MPRRRFVIRTEYTPHTLTGHARHRVIDLEDQGRVVGVFDDLEDAEAAVDTFRRVIGDQGREVV